MASAVFKHEYYGPLLQHYIEQIINCGILLDEDMEVLLGSYEYDITNNVKNEFPVALTASAVVLVSSVFWAKLLEVSPSYLIPPTLVTAGIAIKEAKYRRKKHQHYQLMTELTTALRNLTSLNQRIVKYMKTRQKITEKYDVDFFKLFNKSVLEFMNRYSKSQFDLYQFNMTTLESISNFCLNLINDFQYYKSINPSTIIKEVIEGETEECIKYVETLHDVQVLVNSKLLGYLGIVFCDKKHSRLDQINLEIILNIKIPHIIQHIRSHHDYINSIFFNLKQSVLHLTNCKVQKNTVNKKFINTKLDNSLECTLYNLSFIVEKTYNILETINNGDQKDSSEKINKGLLDLRNHTLAVYESVDVLCKLYGILVQADKRIGLVNAANLAAQTKKNTAKQEELKTINFDDEIEALDEKYELYLDGQCNDTDPLPVYEEQSDKYINLMLQELKQSLKQHEKFIEARKRRGSAEEEQEIHLKHISEPEPIPKFQVEGLKIGFKDSKPYASKVTIPFNTKTCSINIPDDEKISEIVKVEYINNKPVTRRYIIHPNEPGDSQNGHVSEDGNTNDEIIIPPPMPLLEIDTGNNSTIYSELLQGVKFLSGQRNAEEETFEAHYDEDDAALCLDNQANGD